MSLERRKNPWFLPSLALAVLYYLMVVLMHEHVGLFINETLFHGWERQNYNQVITGLFLIGNTVLLGWIIYRISDHTTPLNAWWWSAYILTMSLMFGSWKFLFVINIEAIHFVQYGIVAVWILTLSQRPWAALLLSTLLGIFDEAYQFFILAPNRTWYYDMNDVILNLLGAAWGILIYLYAFPPSKPTKKQSWPYYTAAILFSIIFVLWLLDYFHLRIGENGALLKRPINKLWYTIDGSITYHVVGPTEGFWIVGGLLTLYAVCFTRLQKHNASSQHTPDQPL